jgi:hypothetical protein
MSGQSLSLVPLAAVAPVAVENQRAWQPWQQMAATLAAKKLGIHVGSP